MKQKLVFEIYNKSEQYYCLVVKNIYIFANYKARKRDSINSIKYKYGKTY